MKRWLFGLLVSAFFAGVTFVLTTVIAGLFHVYRHGSGALHAWSEAHSRHLAITLAVFAGLITLTVWARATRAD
jgi:hypothetical protein